MAKRLEDQMKALHLEVTIRQTQGLLRTPDDWHHFTTILSEMSERQAAEDQSFAHDFEARLETAEDVVLREHLGLRPDQPLQHQVRPEQLPDRFVHAAEVRVYADHHRRKPVIKDDALDALKNLSSALRARNAPTRTDDHLHDPSPDGSSARQTPRRSGPSR